MIYKAAIAATALAVVGAPALAQGFTGGQLGIEYNAPTDGSDFGGTTYHGGLEYAITRNISVAADATGYNPDTLNIAGTNITLHGIYHLSDTASAGVFVGQDTLDDNDSSVNTYGIEGGTEFMGGEIGGYLGTAEGDDSDATLFGIDGAYAVRNGISVVAAIDAISFNSDASVTRTTLGAEYQLQGGPEFYAHVGNISAEASGTADDQTFIGLGATISFGAARGTTFEGRSTFDSVAGF